MDLSDFVTENVSSADDVAAGLAAVGEPDSLATATSSFADDEEAVVVASEVEELGGFGTTTFSPAVDTAVVVANAVLTASAPGELVGFGTKIFSSADGVAAALVASSEEEPGGLVNTTSTVATVVAAFAGASSCRGDLSPALL